MKQGRGSKEFLYRGTSVKKKNKFPYGNPKNKGKKSLQQINKSRYQKTYQKPILKKNHIKIRYGRIFIALVCFGVLLFFFSQILKISIQTIYIKGNVYLSDQEIIELAEIQNYPSIIKTSIFDLKRKLKKDARIRSVSIRKKGRSIYFEIVENLPLFYNQGENKTVLADFREVEEIWDAPVLMNYVPDTLYSRFKEKMQLVDSSILNRVSEIMYQPSNVDTERFLFTMRDGNYVYLTLETLESINNYVSIYAEFTSKYGNKNGILNLDSGQYFTILE